MVGIMHSRMLRDDKFTAYFDAWRDMDKQLRTQFISRPFIVDPSTTYVQLLERARMDSFFARAEKAQQSFELQRARVYGSRSTRQGGGPAPHRYMPYEKDNNRGKPTNSFHENKKPILCLHCGYTGHHAGNCTSNQSNHPERPIACDWRHDKLISKSNKVICVLFNVWGHAWTLS